MKRIFFYISVWLLCGCSIGDAQEVLASISSSFSGVETIQVKSVFCNVKVYAGSSQTVEVDGEIRGVRRVDEIKIRTQQSGSVLEVWVEYPRNFRGNVKGFLDLEVPVEVSLKAESVSGNIKATGVGRELVWLKTVSGNVEAQGIPCDLEAASVSGNVIARMIEGNLEAQSVSGNLQVSNVTGALKGGSTSGNVKVEMIEGAVKVKTTSGDCILNNVLNSTSVTSTSGSIRISGSKAHLKAYSLSGDILLEECVGSFNLETLSGDQKGNGLMLTDSSQFHSASGNISMLFSNPEGALSYRLSSGSGSLKAAGQSADRQLVVENGPIVVIGVSASGSQSYQ
jgi:hypothetical protein